MNFSVFLKGFIIANVYIVCNYISVNDFQLSLKNQAKMLSVSRFLTDFNIFKLRVFRNIYHAHIEINDKINICNVILLDLHFSRRLLLIL